MGGAEQHGLFLAIALANLGNQVYYSGRKNGSFQHPVDLVLKTVRTPFSVADKGFIAYLIKFALGNLLTVISAVKTLHRQSFDIIHVHSTFAACVLTNFQRLYRRRVPVILTVHDPPPNFHIFGPVERTFRALNFYLFDFHAYRNADGLICVSNSIRSLLLHRFRADPDKTIFLPNGFSEAAWDNLSGSGLSLHETPIPKIMPKRYSVFVGKIVRRKGLGYLLELGKLLESRGIKMVIVGDGPDLDSFKRSVVRNGREQNTILTGRLTQEQVCSVLSNALAFIHTSLQDGMPTSVLEAMWMGIPPISFRTPSVDGVIANNKNGFLVEIGDVDEMLKVLCTLERNQDLWQKISMNAHRTILDNFTWQKLALKVMEVYRLSIVRGKPASQT